MNSKSHLMTTAAAPATVNTKSYTKPAETFLSDANLAGRYDTHRATIWGWLKRDASFPRPIKLSPGCTRWRLSDIEAWEAAKAAA